jgi:hypothetical protein
MAQILKFTELETLAILGAVYDRAVTNVRDDGHSICELIADRIISAATQGERDGDTLYKFALHGIGLRHLS